MTQAFHPDDVQRCIDALTDREMCGWMADEAVRLVLIVLSESPHARWEGIKEWDRGRLVVPHREQRFVYEGPPKPGDPETGEWHRPI